MTPDRATPATPYAEHANEYYEKGWHGVLPLPEKSKHGIPKGFTGREGAWPSKADILTWTETPNSHNIALRVPGHVIGIDVDAYDHKQGAATMAAAVQRLGPLPPTWVSTSRDDGTSGIAFYRVPRGLSWPGQVGPDVEIIQKVHRYAVVAPSVHPNGKPYFWKDPSGTPTIHRIPAVDDLPELPDTWVTAITGGQLDTGDNKTNLTRHGVNTWILEHDGDMCRVMEHVSTQAVANITQPGSRHDAAISTQRALAGLAAEGHTGLTTALRNVHAAFTTAATLPGTGQRSTDQATAEWERGLAGAVQIAAAQQQRDHDPCVWEWEGLIDPPPEGVNAPQAPQEGIPGSIPAPHYPVAPEADGGARERSTWWPVDLEAALSGENPEPGPQYLTRDDNQPLIYPAKVNGIIGESESGKTWVALLAVQQALASGTNVTYLDFEDTAPGIVTRLLDMGTDPGHIRAHLNYVGPDQSLDVFGSTDFAEHLDTWQPGLVIVDGVNAAMTLLGLDLISNTDATRFAQTLLRPISARGAAVLYVDHTPKSKENDTKGGIGAQAKRAMTTGAAFKVEVIKAFGKGQDGKLRIRVDKDRPGHVRGVSKPNKNGHWAGDAIINSTPGGGISITITNPEESAAETGTFRPTHLMERVSRFLATMPEGASKNAITGGVGGQADAVRKAADVLVEEGYAERSNGPRNAIILRHIRPFTELADLTSSHLVPTSSHFVPDEVAQPSTGRSSSTSSESPGGGLGGDEVAPGWAVAEKTSENGSTSSRSSDIEKRTCRACGVITERGQDVPVAGRCKDCRIAGREIRP